MSGSQHKGDLFVSEGQKNRQTQEIEDEEEGEGNKGKGARIFVPGT